MMDDKLSPAEWLKEHLAYELDMLHFTLERISVLPESPEWNAHFESFAVHARNLYGFLTNDSGQGNYNASDFVPHFRSAKTDLTKGAFPKLLFQVLHLGKRRPTSTHGKFTLDICRQFYSWIEENFKMFTDQLGEPYASAWAGRSTGPAKPTSLMVQIGDGAKASSQPTSVGTVGFSQKR